MQFLTKDGMSYPEFFNQAKKITVYDPLAHLLGSSSDGLIEYSYIDAVKQAGHSCPTVAGAYLMAIKALVHLYPGEIPQRGGLKAEFHEGVTDGVAGVMASVVSLITGCAGEGGFKGLAGNHVRRNLLSFNHPVNGQIRFQRMDTGHAVTISYHPNLVPPSPEVFALLRKILNGVAQQTDKEAFAAGWQERVKMILEQADNPKLVVCS